MQQPTKHGWMYRVAIVPVLGLLRLGMSPERLAWSLAVGLVIGINPVLGSTTVVCLAVASLLRLNLLASQLTNHLVYPLQLLLFLPFLRLGTRLFRAAPMPMTRAEILHLARSHPLELSRRLWLWESHALVAWLLLALAAAPIFALLLTPLLRRLKIRIDRSQCPAPADPVATGGS